MTSYTTEWKRCIYDSSVKEIKFRIMWTENENCNKSICECLLTLDYLSTPKVAFGDFWKELAPTKPVTWESGKYNVQELTTFGFSCHSSGKVSLEWGMKRMWCDSFERLSTADGVVMTWLGERKGGDSKTLGRKKREDKPALPVSSHLL